MLTTIIAPFPEQDDHRNDAPREQQAEPVPAIPNASEAAGGEPEDRRDSQGAAERCHSTSS